VHVSNVHERSKLLNRLYNNQIAGTLQPIAHLTFLTYMSFTNNPLVGTLDWVVNLTRMVYFISFNSDFGLSVDRSHRIPCDLAPLRHVGRFSHVFFSPKIRYISVIQMSDFKFFEPLHPNRSAKLVFSRLETGCASLVPTRSD
jgi:hypothetical protein